MFFWGKHNVSEETLLLFYEGKLDNYNLFKSHLYILKKAQYNTFLRPHTTDENKKYNRDLLQSWRDGKRIEFSNPHDHIVWNVENSALLPDYIRLNKSEIIDSTHKRLASDSLSQDYYTILFQELDYLHKEIISSKYYKEEFSRKLEYIKNSIQKAKDSFGNHKFVKETLIPKHSYSLFDKCKNIEKLLKELHFKTDSHSNFSIIDSKLSKAYENVSNGNLNSAFNELKSITSEIFSMTLEKQVRKELKEKVDYYFLLIQQKREIISDEKTKTYQTLLREIANTHTMINSITNNWGEAFSILKSLSGKIFSSHVLKEHKNDLKSKLDECYNTLNYRKEKTQKEYEDKCNTNYYRLSSDFSSITRYQYCSDEELNDAMNVTKDFRMTLKNTNPLKKEQRDELYQRTSYYYDLFYKRLKEYKEEKRNNWIQSQYNKIDKLQGVIKNKEQYIDKLGGVISNKENYLYTTRNPDKQSQVRYEIQEIEQKIRQAYNEISSLNESIRDIRSKI